MKDFLCNLRRAWSGLQQRLVFRCTGMHLRGVAQSSLILAMGMYVHRLTISVVCSLDVCIRMLEDTTEGILPARPHFKLPVSSSLCSAR